jgi:hypothetical protein
LSSTSSMCWPGDRGSSSTGAGMMGGVVSLTLCTGGCRWIRRHKEWWCLSETPLFRMQGRQIARQSRRNWRPGRVYTQPAGSRWVAESQPKVIRTEGRASSYRRSRDGGRWNLAGEAGDMWGIFCGASSPGLQLQGAITPLFIEPDTTWTGWSRFTRLHAMPREIRTLSRACVHQLLA